MDIIEEEKVVQIIAHAVMIVLASGAVLPFWLLIAASFSSEEFAIQNGYKFYGRV